MQDLSSSLHLNLDVGLGMCIPIPQGYEALNKFIVKPFEIHHAHIVESKMSRAHNSLPN